MGFRTQASAAFAARVSGRSFPWRDAPSSSSLDGWRSRWRLRAYAQTAPSITTQLDHAQAAPSVTTQLDHAQTDLRNLERSAGAPDVDDPALAKLYFDVPPIEAGIHQAIDPLRPQLVDVDARLSALGPAPKSGAPPEAAAIAHDRKAFTAQHEALDAQIKRGDLMLVEADQLEQQLASGASTPSRSASASAPSLFSIRRFGARLRPSCPATSPGGPRSSRTGRKSRARRRALSHWLWRGCSSRSP